MKVGVTGHQRREGADWSWVSDTLHAELRALGSPLDGYSSLAAGADQLFARAVLDVGGRHYVVIPLDDYADRFDDERDAAAYRRLRALSHPIQLHGSDGSERAFLEAGEWIVRHVDLLIAVWDGEPAHGLGGTADIVGLAQARSLATIILDPVARTRSRTARCR